ncbi:class I SAM-dependent methyltransferase [Candidatus Woesearchaeota archaeon]|nr:class I SAM-dependent methyltransferase [Candidatus Woesearchaeota archaeon]
MTYYNEISKGYNELYKEEQLKKLSIIKENLNIKQDSRLLDVGCGTAFSLDYLNCTKIGVDPSQELLKQSKHPVIKGEAENLPFKDKEFDFVISLTAIHNFHNIEKGLKEMKRVGNEFAFSILKNSKNFEIIESLIKKNFKSIKTIEEEKDTIFFGKA